MSETKAGKFINEAKHVIELDGPGLDGTVTLPIIMTGHQLALYVNSTRDNVKLAEEAEEEGFVGEPVTRELTTWNNIHHLVLRIDFPHVSMANFKDSDKRPWPALTFKIEERVRPIINAALNIKKLES